MKHWLTYTGKFTAVYIIMYLLLNSVFVHTHLIDGKLVTHSHPFTANQHTSNYREDKSEHYAGTVQHTNERCVYYKDAGRI